jgi:hypothetical protein
MRQPDPGQLHQQKHSDKTLAEQAACASGAEVCRHHDGVGFGGRRTCTHASTSDLLQMDCSAELEPPSSLTNSHWTSTSG